MGHSLFSLSNKTNCPTQLRDVHQILINDEASKYVPIFRQHLSIKTFN